MLFLFLDKVVQFKLKNFQGDIVYLSKIKKIVVGISLVLPMTTFAAGLGQLSIASGIGEPLSADIQLLSLSTAEKASLKARIAPASTYAAQGLERPASHSNIQIRVAKSPSGKNILKLQSNQPITEPFLDMLVELEWETGRILREYTVLLDPPGYDTTVSATSTVQTPVVKTLDKSKITPIKSSGAIKNTVQKSNTSVTKSSTNKSNKAPLDTDYLTRRGDTLSKIARRMKPEGVSLDQMLVGLYEANPEAFDGKNMNRLKVGKILQPPTQEALNANTRKQAVKEVKVQAANWNKYRNKLAGIVSDSIPAASEKDKQAASGKIKSSAEDKSIPESKGPKDVVKLSSGDAKAQADMEAKITALQEEVSAREKGLQEAQERTAALEKQIEDMQKLLTLRSDALTEAQDIDEKVTAAVAAQPTEQSETAKEEVIAAAPAKPAVKAKPVSKPKAPEVPVEQPGFMANLLKTASGMLSGLNSTLLAAGALGVALLTGGWFYLRNKRRKNLADFEQGIMTSGGLKANTVFGNTSGASVDTGDTSFLTDFSQSTSGGMIDTNDVDPIAEAEVYMAYGRDAQAEEILKDAISKEPKRYELHLKLLEMYAASKNMSAFETVSGELYTTLGAEDPTWAKVAEIGIILEPNNPLYQAESSVGVTTEQEDAASSASNDVGDEVNTEGELDVSDFSNSPLAAEADLDFSLNDDLQAEANPQEVEKQTPDSSDVEAIESVDVDEAVLDIPNVSEVLDTQDTALEFDLNTTTEETQDEVLEVVIDETNFMNTMPNLDFPSLNSEEPQVDAELDSITEQLVPELEMPDGITLDMPETTDDLEMNVSEVAEEATAESFDFDVNTLTEGPVTLGGADASGEDALVLDISDISLEVNDDVNTAIAEATLEAEPENVSTEAESEEVETKLELVAAYIDMEDKDGAKELLDEVLKEGGANQRKRAEELLATLG